MKIIVNKTKYSFTVVAEKNDLPKIRQLENLIKSDDWIVMQEAYFNLREAIIELVEDVAPSLQGERAAIIKNAILKGFDQTANLPTQIIKASLEIQDTEEANDPVGAGWVGEV